jgi:hypothetical protein
MGSESASPTAGLSAIASSWESKSFRRFSVLTGALTVTAWMLGFGPADAQPYPPHVQRPGGRAPTVRPYAGNRRKLLRDDVCGRLI